MAFHLDPGGGIAWIDRRERFITVLVSGQSRTDAVVELPYEVQVQPAAGSPAPAEVPT